MPFGRYWLSLSSVFNKRNPPPRLVLSSWRKGKAIKKRFPLVWETASAWNLKTMLSLRKRGEGYCLWFSPSAEPIAADAAKGRSPKLPLFTFLNFLSKLSLSFVLALCQTVIALNLICCYLTSNLLFIFLSCYLFPENLCSLFSRLTSLSLLLSFLTQSLLPWTDTLPLNTFMGLTAKQSILILYIQICFCLDLSNFHYCYFIAYEIWLLDHWRCKDSLVYKKRQYSLVGFSTKRLKFWRTSRRCVRTQLGRIR